MKLKYAGFVIAAVDIVASLISYLQGDYIQAIYYTASATLLTVIFKD